MPASRLAAGGTLWWLEPAGVCDGRIAMQGDVDVLDPEAVRWEVGSWIEDGGTDRSYGLHVGRLAGLPETVLARATVLPSARPTTVRTTAAADAIPITLLFIF